MAKEDSMLTTIDNPFNPFEDFIQWWKKDLLLGHDCCGLLAREANINDLASENVNDRDITDAMDRIVKEDPIYKIVYPTDYKKVSSG